MNGRTAAFRLAQVMGFFVDHRVSNSVYGYIVNLPGMYIGGIGPAPGGSFPKAIRLVQ